MKLSIDVDGAVGFGASKHDPTAPSGVADGRRPAYAWIARRKCLKRKAEIKPIPSEFIIFPLQYPTT